VAVLKGLEGVYTAVEDFLSKAGFSPLLYTPDVVRLRTAVVVCAPRPYKGVSVDTPGLFLHSCLVLCSGSRVCDSALCRRFFKSCL